MSSATVPDNAPPLLGVRRGRIESPRRDLVYGPPGIGKTTFAASYPGVIFLTAEEGTSELDVARLPPPADWKGVLELVDQLIKNKHDFESLAIDTLDWLEPLVWAEVCRRANKGSIEDFGYGKGYVAAADEARVLIARLDELQRMRDMNVVLVAHSLIKKFDNPEGEPYDRYQLKLHEKFGGLFKEWCKSVLFARYESVATKAGKTHTIGLSTGARVLHTQWSAAWDAKNRYGLPPQLPLSYEEFDVAVRAAAPGAVDKLQQQIRELLPQVADEQKRGAVADWLRQGDNATNPIQLARAVDRLHGLVALSRPAPTPELEAGGEKGGAT